MDKPKCFGTYKSTFAKQGRVCRSCFAAQDCKVTEPKRGRPAKVSEPEEVQADE